MKKIIIFLMTLGVGVCAQSEIRTWIEQDGTEHEAEFVRELFDKLTLRDANGKEFRLAVEELSETDQKYIRVMVPPEIEVGFSKKAILLPKNKEPKGDSDQDINYLIKPTITLTKKSKRVFTSSMNLQVFLVGSEKDGDNYVLLSISDFKVLFGAEKNSTLEFKSEPQKVTTFKASDLCTVRGEEYEGYLVVLSTREGQIFQIESDIGDWIEDSEVIDALRELYTRGAASRFSRHFDKTGHKSELPRHPFYRRRLSL